MKKIITSLLAVVMVFSLLAGCTTQNDEESKASATAKPPEPIKIGVSIMEMSAYTWFLGARDGCEQWGKEHPEANFTFQFEDSASDVSTMLNNIDNLITAGAKGIILFPADASSAIPTIKQAVSQGIPFIIGDYKQDPANEADAVWSTFVGHDMRALGVTAGKVAVDYLKILGKDNPVCLFITRPTSGQVSIDRFEGFSSTILVEFPNARIIEEGDVGAGSRASSQDLTENILQRETVIDVVCGHNDAEVIGAYNAAVSQNREGIKFIGIAGDKDVFKFLSEGNEAWLAEVLQDPVVLGYLATDAIYKVLVLNQTLPDKYDLPEPEAITPENIANYDWQNWSWL